MADGVQDEPVEDGSHDASVEEKKQGILVQVAADMRGRPHEDVIGMLTQRLDEARIPADADEVRELAASLPPADETGTGHAKPLS